MSDKLNLNTDFLDTNTSQSTRPIHVSQNNNEEKIPALSLSTAAFIAGALVIGAIMLTR